MASKILNRAIAVGGDLKNVNSAQVNVLEYAIDSSIRRARGATVPSDAAKGFEKGALFVKTGGTTGTTWYINEGSSTSCDFNAVEAGTPIFSDGEAILDNNGNELEVFGVTSSAVNEVKLTNAATGNAPSFKAQGGDTNVALLLAGKGTGAVQLGQATSVGVTLIADQPILDSSANEYIKFTKATTAVNEITIANAATTASPVISATGGDTNINVSLAAKGTGVVGLGQATSAGVTLIADQPFLDSSSNEYIKFVKTASAVNEITVTNNAAAAAPSITATGGDTNIDLSIGGKGTGLLKTASRGTATAAAGAATSNTQSGLVTTEALTTAAGAQYTLTLTNDKIGFGSILLVTVANGTSTAGTPSLTVASQGSGSATIIVQNIHGANAFNGTLKISFLVM